MFGSSSPWVLVCTLLMIVMWVTFCILMASHGSLLSSADHQVLQEHHVSEARRNFAIIQEQNPLQLLPLLERKPLLNIGADNQNQEPFLSSMKLDPPALRGAPPQNLPQHPLPQPPSLPIKQPLQNHDTSSNVEAKQAPSNVNVKQLSASVATAHHDIKPQAIAISSSPQSSAVHSASFKSGMPEKPTIFVSIAAYREQRGARTIASAFANAKYPERLFIGLYQQRNPDEDPDGLDFDLYCAETVDAETRNTNAALCRYGPTHVTKEELHWTKSEGPCVARAMAEQMYNGQDFVFQIDAHSTFVKDWDEMMLRMWSQTNNEYAVLSGYPRSEGQMTQSLKSFRNLAMICTARMLDWSVRHMLKNTAGDSPMRPHPVRTPYFGAGLVFSKAHRLAAVPYDPYLHYLFDGEEFDMAMRLFTSGYDIYAPNETPLFHFYSSPAENKRMGIAKFWDYQWGKRFPIMFQSTRRIRHKIGIPAVLEQDPKVHDTKGTDILTQLDKYTVGKRRSVEMFLDYAGIDLIEKTVRGACRKVREGLHHVPWVTDTEMDHGLDGGEVL